MATIFGGGFEDPQFAVDGRCFDGRCFDGLRSSIPIGFLAFLGFLCLGSHCF